MERLFRIIVGVVFAAGLLVYSGCDSDESVGRFTDEQIEQYSNESQPQYRKFSENMALSVGSDTISVEDIVDAMEPVLKDHARVSDFKEFYNYAGPLILGKIVDKASEIVLYERAKKDADEKMEDHIEKYAETEMGKFIGRYGNDYSQAEEVIKQRGLISWEEFREFKRKEFLLTYYYSRQMQAFTPSASPDEIRKYYDDNIDMFKTEAVMEFKLIDIVPERLSGEQVNTDAGETKEEAAMRLAHELVERIKAGEDFAELAKKYSNGHNASKGGDWGTRRPGQLAQPWAVLEDTMKKMSWGGVSDPIETDGHVFIVKVIRYSSDSVKDFNEVRDEIAETIKFDQRRKYISKIATDNFDARSLPYLQEFVEICVRQAYKKYKYSE